MYGKVGPIEAVADVGQNVLLIDNGSYKLYKVAYREPVPTSHPLVAEVTAGAGLAAGGMIPNFNTQPILDLNDGNLGQFRVHVIDDVHVVISEPGALQLFALMNQIATVNAFTRIEDPCDHLTEFFIWEQQRIFLRVTNPSAYAITQARVAFYGYRYVLEGPKGPGRGISITPIAEYQTMKEAVASGEKFTVVPVGGWPR